MNRLTRARSLLLLDHPFFGALALRLTLQENKTISTMATDGKAILYNPTFVDGLTDDELQGVFAHEVMHVANGHCWRRGDREHGAWNVACDKAINGIIIKAGLKLPDGALPGYNDSAEALYREYGGGGDKGQEQGQKQGQSQGQDPGGCGAVMDAPSDEDVKEMEADWREAVASAYRASKGRGNMPAELERLVKEIVDPSVDWRTLLRDFVERNARNDYDWTRANRRHLGRGIILPSLTSEEIPCVVLVVDTSASINNDVLARFSQAASDVLSAYDTTLHVIHADAKVQNHVEYRREDLPLKLTHMGGGGTDFRPTFTWVDEQGLVPSVLIYLTDLGGRFPEEEPEYPVLWVTPKKKKHVPFGDVVEMP